MHRALSLSVSLSPPSSSSLLFFREQLWLRITFMKLTVPSPRSSPQVATVLRVLRQSLHALQVMPSTCCFEYTTLISPHLVLKSFVAPKRLSSNRPTRTLHDSLLQGHILPSRGPRHPRPAPLVLQVLVSRHVIDWGEGLGVLGLPPDLFLLSFMPCGFLDLDSIPRFFPPALLSPIPPLFSHCL
jgi:hypothetical protein